MSERLSKLPTKNIVVTSKGDTYLIRPFPSWFFDLLSEENDKTAKFTSVTNRNDEQDKVALQKESLLNAQ